MVYDGALYQLRKFVMFVRAVFGQIPNLHFMESGDSYVVKFVEVCLGWGFNGRHGKWCGRGLGFRVLRVLRGFCMRRL